MDMEVMGPLLEAYCRQADARWREAQLIEMECISAGWESDVYVVALDAGAEREELVLRLYCGDHSDYKAGLEFQAMRRLYQAGYPVPRVFRLERDASPFGRPFMLMERIHGDMLWRTMFRAEPERRDALLAAFCGLLARLHALDARPFDGGAGGTADEGPGRVTVESMLSWTRGMLAPYADLGFGSGMEWLDERRHTLPPAELAPVHWDFHPANVLRREDDSMIVIDWTQFMVTDPRFDLAWTLLLVGSQEGPQWREPMLREYERQGGGPVDDLDFFDAYACLKRLASVTISLSAGPEKLGMRPEAVEAMRRQLGPMGRVYEMWLNRTGVPMSGVEAMLDSRI
jgi:aminoglycoside phosphotransferase (APT) family kinase protein